MGVQTGYAYPAKHNCAKRRISRFDYILKGAMLKQYLKRKELTNGE